MEGSFPFLLHCSVGRETGSSAVEHSKLPSFRCGGYSCGTASTTAKSAGSQPEVCGPPASQPKGERGRGLAFLF